MASEAGGCVREAFNKAVTTCLWVVRSGTTHLHRAV